MLIELGILNVIPGGAYPYFYASEVNDIVVKGRNIQFVMTYRLCSMRVHLLNVCS
jgi:hypothetical protein